MKEDKNAMHDRPHPPTDAACSPLKISRRRVVQMLTFTPLLACYAAVAEETGVAAEPQEQTGAPGTRPMLRIEAGMHTSTLRRIVVSPDGKTVYTNSHDQTIRAWSLPDGQLLRVLRVPIGESPDGKLLPLALSPDGKTLATGGWTGYGWDRVDCVFLVDAITGTLKRRITGLADRAHCMAFSPDGATLAVGLDGRNGVRLFRVADGQELARDTDYRDICIELDFDARGRLATVGFDNMVRLYAPTLQLLAKVQAPGQSHALWGVRFSPDGSKIAVGYNDRLQVHVFAVDSDTITFLFSPDTSGVNNGGLVSFGTVAWSSDGSLWAGGRYSNGNPAGSYPVRRWLDGGRGEYRDMPASDNIIFDLRPLPGGSMAFAAADPAFGVLDASGRRLLKREPANADFRDQQEKLLVDPTGGTVAFGYGQFGASQARFTARERSLVVRDSANSADFDAALSTMNAPILRADGDLNITQWKENFNPRLNGRMLPFVLYDFSRSLAVAPNRSRFLLGTTWFVRCYDRSGTSLWQYAAPDFCLALNVAAGNGSIAVGAFADGTIRWLRMRDGKELLAFFPHADKKRWVCWTPSGYYDCSPGGEDLIGWHLNRGPDVTPDFYPASRFRNIFYRPDVVSYVLTTLDEVEALRMANADRVKAPQAATPTTVTANLPPTVIVRSPANFSSFSEGVVTVRVLVRTPLDADITAITARVDGRPVPLQRGLDFSLPPTNARPAPGGQREMEYEVPVPVPTHDCEVGIFAENKNAVSAPAVLHLKWAKVPLPEAAVIKPKLYVLAVGVGEYKSADIRRLAYPGKDARDFAAAVQRQKGSLYRDVEVRLLTDKDATHDAVMDGLEWIQTNTTSRDVAMVFFAGHGANSPNRVFHFLPYDFSPARFKATGVARADIQATLEQIPGKVLFFLDSCDSGNVIGTSQTRGEVDITGVVNELSSAESGVVVFCASGKFQSALEDPAWHNGAFTKALLEALAGIAAAPPPGKDTAAILAALRQSGKLTIPLLESYIAERVKDLTAGRQSPCFPPSPTNSLNNVTLAVVGAGRGAE